MVQQIFLLGVETGLNLIPVVGLDWLLHIHEGHQRPRREFEKNDILKLKTLTDDRGEVIGTYVVKDAIEAAIAIAANLAKRGKAKKAGLKIVKFVAS